MNFAKLNFPAQRVGRYLRVFFWSATDSLWRLRKLSIFVLACGFAGLLAQIGAIAVSVGYAHSLEKGKIITVLDRSLEPRRSFELVVICAAGVLLLLMFSAFAAYVAGSKSISLRRRYQEIRTWRVFQIAAERDLLWLPSDSQFQGSVALQRLVRGDAAFSGRVVQLLLKSVVPAFSAIAAFLLILYLEPASTLLIFLTLLISTRFLYRASREASNSSLEMAKRAAGANRTFKRHLERHQSSNDPSTSPPQDIASIFGGKIGAHMDARDRSFLAIEKGNLVSNGFLSIILFMVVLSFGYSIVGHGSGWGRLLTYLISLRHGLVNLRSLTALITNVNRFYPSMLRHYRFEKYNRRIEGPFDGIRLLSPQDDPIPGSLGSASVQRGDTITVLTPFPLNRLDAGGILYPLAGGDDYLLALLLSSSRIADISQLLAEAESRRSPPDRPQTEAAASSEASALERNRQMGAELSEGWPPEESSRTDLTASGFSAASQDLQLTDEPARPVILVPRTEFESVSAEEKQLLEILLRENILILVSNNYQLEHSLGETFVVVSDLTTILGFGSTNWYFEHRAEISQKGASSDIAGKPEDGESEENLADETDLV